MKAFAQFLLLGSLLLLCFRPPVFAARNLVITGNKSTLFGDEELVITASASGFTEGETIYIKGAFFQSGSTNYFGLTKSGDSWIKNSQPNAEQRMIVIGQWDNTLTLRSDFADSGYKGEGEYQIKVRFYWGSSFSSDWSSNALAVTVNEPDPTSTFTPTPSHSPTPSPTTAPATSTPTPTKTPTPTNTPTSTSSPFVEEESSESAEEEPEEMVLGSVVESSGSGRKLRAMASASALVAAGLALLSGVLVWQKRNALHDTLDK